jgi:hypothetical protein
MVFILVLVSARSLVEAICSSRADRVDSSGPSVAPLPPPSTDPCGAGVLVARFGRAAIIKVNLVLPARRPPPFSGAYPTRVGLLRTGDDREFVAGFG